MFSELEAFNPRDQLAFAYVRDNMSPKLKLNMFEEQVFEDIAVEYRHSLKRVGIGANEEGSKASNGKGTKRASHELLFINGSSCSSCQNYLLKMWGS